MRRLARPLWPRKVRTRLALLYAAFLFLPAALVACFLPKPQD